MNTYQWYNSKDIPKIVSDCMLNIKSLSDNYILIEPDHKMFDKDEIDPRCESDLLRCKLLSKDPDGEWIDTDSEKIKNFIPPKDNKPYFSQGIRGRANGDIIIANGNTKVFIDLIKKYNKVDHKPGWMQRILNSEFKDKICLIPDGYYIHLALCHTSHLMEGQSVSTGKAVIQKINGELKRII
jgi:hypothetical protein